MSSSWNIWNVNQKSFFFYIDCRIKAYSMRHHEINLNNLQYAWDFSRASLIILIFSNKISKCWPLIKGRPKLKNIQGHKIIGKQFFKALDILGHCRGYEFVLLDKINNVVLVNLFTLANFHIKKNPFQTWKHVQKINNLPQLKHVNLNWNEVLPI